jgi:hypothetical protein
MNRAKAASPLPAAVLHDIYRYQGIADTFVQLFLSCIAVLIADVDRRRRWNSRATANGLGATAIAGS